MLSFDKKMQSCVLVLQFVVEAMKDVISCEKLRLGANNL